MKERLNKIFEKEIYKPDFPLYGPHLIAASAGTGKTYQLQNIYARLILETDLRVSEILVMTFTKDATQELKERIHQILKALKDQLENNSAAQKDKRIQQLLACAEARQFDRRLLQRKVELALLEFDNAAISTIHGFCERTLARYTFETGFPFDAELANEQKEFELHRMVKDWILTATEEEKNLIDIKKLNKAVTLLGGKTDWRIDENDPVLCRAKVIVDEYESQRQERKFINFDDLLRGLREALHNDTDLSLAKRLRMELKAALVDEFQDTDPVQYEILQKLFLTKELPACPVYLVGDPKQSIYSFRSGDIFTYKAAVDALEPEQKYDLVTNFRSSPRLLSAVNAFFKGANTFQSADIPYTTDVLSGGDHPLLLCNDIEEKTPFKVLEHNSKERTIFQYFADEVVHVLHDYRIKKQKKNFEEEEETEKKVTPKDIAILADTHKNIQAIAQALQESSVPYVIEKTGNVFSGSAARNLLTVLKTIISGGNIQNIRLSLASVLFSVTDPDDQLLAKWIVKFRELHNCWLKHGFSALIQKMEQFSKSDDGNCLRKRLASGDPADLTDYDEVCNLMIAAEKELGAIPFRLVSWLEKRLLSIEQEKDIYARTPETDSDAVRIMTIHKSKGLQFPIVFLHGALSSSSQVSFHSFHAPDPECDMQPADSPQPVLQFTADKQLAETEENQEKIRKFYVAMTRAELMTVLIHPQKKPNTLSQLFTNAKNNTADNMPDSAIEWRTESYTPGVYLPEQPEISRTAETPRIFTPSFIKGSYSSLQLKSGDIQFDTDEEDRDDFIEITGEDPAKNAHAIFQIPGGTNTGNCWHFILEHLPFDAGDRSIDELSANALSAHGFDPEKIYADKTLRDITADMIRKTLNHPLTAPDGKTFALCQTDSKFRSSEQSFDFSSVYAQHNTAALAEILCRHWQDIPEKKDFITAVKNWKKPIPRGMFTGFFDLVFAHNGYYYIVDWKSNSLKSERIRRSYSAPDPERDALAFDTPGVTREMAEHWYFFQYLLYAVVLHRSLKQIPGSHYSWEKNFGGIRYFFLRGIAADGRYPVFSDRPQEPLLDELAAALGMRS